MCDSVPVCVCICSDASQSDSNSKDFWFNMPALMSYLRKAAEQNPTASYYNVDILKYQVCGATPQNTPISSVTQGFINTANIVLYEHLCTSARSLIQNSNTK